jgi:hypothetical protein
MKIEMQIPESDLEFIAYLLLTNDSRQYEQSVVGIIMFAIAIERWLIRQDPVDFSLISFRNGVPWLHLICSHTYGLGPH